MIRKGIFIILIFSFFSCGENINSDKSEYEYSKDYNSGPLKFKIMVNKLEITTAETVKLVMEAVDNSGNTVDFSLSDKSKEVNSEKVDHYEFQIENYNKLPDRLEGDSTLYRKEYILAPELSGNYTIPSVKVEFENNNFKKSIITEKIEIKVLSVLNSANSEHAIKDVTNPVDGNYPVYLYLLMILILCLIIGIIIFLVIYSKNLKKKIKEIVPPWVIAENRLSDLLVRDLVEKGFIKEFYYEISLILRRYIEERFLIKAPEKTTEEFLSELSMEKSEVFFFRPILKEFLTQCDFVKFAAYSPGDENAKDIINICKKFIKETEVKE